jgi:proteic killer suppression protein
MVANDSFPTFPFVILDGNTATRYDAPMIKSVKSPEAERLFRREYVRKLPHDIQRTALRKLWMIDAAPDLISLRVPPGNRLEALAGNRTGQNSIRINDQWRICFRWREGNAHDVAIVDYH